jgi:dCTP diphosphatase
MKGLQKKIKEHLKERDWDKLEPSDLAKSIIIEGAELLEIFQWDNSSRAKIKKDTKKYQDIKDELADIFIYCLEMADALDLDVKKIIESKLSRVQKKYPPQLVKGNQANYLKIKRESRANRQ